MITAPAIAPIDFARTLFEALDLFPAPVVEACLTPALPGPSEPGQPPEPG